MTKYASIPLESSSSLPSSPVVSPSCIALFLFLLLLSELSGSCIFRSTLSTLLDGDALPRTDRADCDVSSPSPRRTRTGQPTLTSSWHLTPLLCSTLVPRALYRQKNDFCNLKRQNALFDEFVTESSHYSLAYAYQPRGLTRSLLALMLRSSPNLEAH
jgi:hypothetical protein